MSTLSDEIVAEILSWLPLVDVIRIKTTCKSWYTLIRDPYFIKLHHRRSIHNNGDDVLISLRSTRQVSLLRSIVETNHIGPAFYQYVAMFRVHIPLRTYKHYQTFGGGLVLLGVLDSLPEFVLWNPFIDKGKSFRFDSIQPHPELEFLHRIDIGVGYDEVSDDYKAVRVVDFSSAPAFCYSKASASQVSVVSIKNNTCKRVQDWPLDQWRSDDFGTSVFFDGAFHYCTRHMCHKSISNGVMREPVVVVFDLRKEKFTVHQIPQYIFQNKSKSGSYSTGLCVLDGHLCLSVNGLDTHEVWVHEEGGGAYNKWTKLYFIQQRTRLISFRQCKPLLLSKIHVVLQDAELLYWYDLQSFEMIGMLHGDHWVGCSGSLFMSDSGVGLQNLTPVQIT